MSDTKPERRSTLYSKYFTYNKYIRSAAVLLAILLLAAGSGVAYAFASSPGNIRGPKFEHLHFRMQVSVDGKPVNFATKAFQQGIAADNCNVDLTTNPFHFHDNKDQFVHVHWKKMTGGELLKFYGWNKIGGVDGMLGYRFDNAPNLRTVPIHGTALPKVPSADKYFVYSGDEAGYRERPLSEFLHQDFEQFFNHESNVEAEDTTGFLDKLFPKAYAHHVAGATHGAEHDESIHSDAELKQLNNLLGNVVIFVQKEEPTVQQVKDKFNHLLPLSDSTCAG